MTDILNNPHLLELAPPELAIPLKVTHAGRTYRVTHHLRPPAPADWFAYEAALQMAVEELPPDPHSDEPRFRLLMRSSDAALELWDRLALAVTGYSLPGAQQAPPGSTQQAAAPAKGGSAQNTPTSSGEEAAAADSLSAFSVPGHAPQRSGGPEQSAGGRAESAGARTGALAPEVGAHGEAGQTAESWRGGASVPPDTIVARRATTEGVRGKPPRVPPRLHDEPESAINWRALVPLAHKEAAVRALTLVAPAQLQVESDDPDSTSDQSTDNYFPLHAEQVPVVLEAAVAGRAYPRLVHLFRPPTVADERTYRRLLAETLIVRGSRHPRTLIPARLPALCRLYDSLILSVEGYALEGRPLASSVHAIQSMDPWHKRVAVQALFGDANDFSQSATETPEIAMREGN